MTMSLESLDKLKSSGRLPALSAVGTALHHMKRCGECSAAEVLDTVEEEAALAELVLQLARSGTPDARDVSCVAEYVRLRGPQHVRAMGLGFAIALSNRVGVCQDFDYDRHWTRGLARAVAAHAISLELGAGSPAECFLLGLLSELGSVALASVFPEQYCALLGLCPSPFGAEMRDQEQSRFGIDHLETTAALLLDYGFPASFGDAVLEADPLVEAEEDPDVPEEMAGVLRAAIQLSAVLLDEPAASDHRHFDRTSLRQGLGLDHDTFTALGERVLEEWGQWGDLLRIPSRASVSFEDLDRLDANTLAVEELGVRAAEAGREPEARELRILVADDDPMTLRLISRHLERDGHEVITATNGREALVSALHNDPQLVIADWMMPEMDGLELCNALRRFDAGRRMYFMLLTGREEEDKVVEAFENGVNDFVSKPFRSKLLLARVRAAQRFVALQRQVALDKRLLRQQIIEGSQMRRRLSATASTDELTELHNRRYAIRRLGEEWAASARNDAPLSVIMIDIDHFKRVNDTHGHDVGDVVLQRTAGVIDASTRKSEVACRLGGEEFLIICSNTDLEQAAGAGERIRAAVEANLIREGELCRSVTISVGIAQRDEMTVDIDNLLKLADEAVYRAKSTGRNRVVCWRRPGQAREAS